MICENQKIIGRLRLLRISIGNVWQNILCVITNDATVNTILRLCRPLQAVAASRDETPSRSGPARTRGRGDCGACAV